MLWSPPGVGKTALVGQLRDMLSGLTGIEWDMRCWDMTHLYDPADSRGIPTVHTMPDGRKVTKWLTPEHMVVDGKPTIILLDDLPTLPQSSQAACYRLLQHGEIGGTVFGSEVVFIGAGNRVGDASAVNAMPFALANRLIHINLGFTLQGWCEWALAAGVPTEVIAFHRFTQGTKLYPTWNDSTSPSPCGLCGQTVAPGSLCAHCIKRSRALPTLRSWADGVGALLKTRPRPNLEYEIYAGLVGPECASEFCGYLRLYRAIPSLDQILLGPTVAPVPTEPSVLYAVATALGRAANPANIDAVVQYLDRLPQEFAVLAVKDAIQRDPALDTTRAMVSWKVRHQELFL
jgi:hypothetical protein